MHVCGLEHLDELCATIVAASAALMSVCVGVIAVVPAVLELLTSRNVEYFVGLKVRGVISSAIKTISHTLWIFALAQASGLVGIVFPIPTVAMVPAALALIGLLLLTYGGLRLSVIAVRSI